MKKWIPGMLVGVVIVIASVATAATVDRYVSSITVNTGEIVSGGIAELQSSDDEVLELTEQQTAQGSGSIQVLPDHDDIYGSDWLAVGCGIGAKYRCVDEFFGYDDTYGTLLETGTIPPVPDAITQSIGMRDAQCVVGVCTAQQVYFTATWLVGGVPASNGWGISAQLGWDGGFPVASHFCTDWLGGSINAYPNSVWQFHISDNSSEGGGSDCTGIFDPDARWYLNFIVACSSDCATPPYQVLITQASMGANDTAVQYAIDVDFTIPMPPVSQQPPGNLTWECDSDNGDDYDIGIVQASSTRWLGELCDGTGTYLEPLVIADVVGSTMTVKITDNGSLVGSVTNIELDVMKASSIQAPWIISSENLGWLIYVISVSMGVLLACYAVYRWRDNE